MTVKNKKNHYFTEDTELAIIEYNNTSDPKKKAEIFTEHIYFPFYKLVENIIHTFKFYYTTVRDLEELKHDIVTILLEEKIHKFDPSIGAKAYSYFGTIVKRWLIQYNNKNYKSLQKVDSIQDTDLEEELYEDIEFQEDNSLDLSEFFDTYVENTYDKLPELFSKQRDLQIADAVLTLFKSRKNLQLFKKKALYTYIKEIIPCKTSHLTKIIKTLQTEFYTQYEYYDSRGLINK